MRYYFLSFFLFITTLVNAQTTTTIATVYKEFQPATIHLTDGRKLKVSLANVFLKNSSLLYLSGNDTKEANMKTLTQVDFPDRTYYTVDTLLAYQVDTVGHDALLCALFYGNVVYARAAARYRKKVFSELHIVHSGGTHHDGVGILYIGRYSVTVAELCKSDGSYFIEKFDIFHDLTFIQFLGFSAANFFMNSTSFSTPS